MWNDTVKAQQKLLQWFSSQTEPNRQTVRRHVLLIISLANNSKPNDLLARVPNSFRAITVAIKPDVSIRTTKTSVPPNRLYL